MRIISTKNYDEMSRAAANIISAQIILKPNALLGVATGSSPIGVYDQLVEWYKKGDLDFSQVSTVSLDEYKGLSPENDQSYRYFMNEYLFDRVNIDKNNTFIPDGTNMDSEAEAKRYEALLKSKGSQDIQILGIGRNGHIGFNEPCDEFVRDTQCVDLTESTINANKRFFASAEDVPKQAYSMGIGSILRAKKIIVVASGEEKAEAVKNAFYGPITPQVPGSILQLHNDVVLVADEAALSMIPK